MTFSHTLFSIYACRWGPLLLSSFPPSAVTLTECPGEGYWLSFNQRLPISHELGDHLYGLLHCSQLIQDEEDAEGEIAGNAVEEEVI